MSVKDVWPSLAALHPHLFSLLAAPQCTALSPLCWTIELCSVAPPPTILGALGTREAGGE